MNPIVIKLAPSAVVLLAGGYMTWPYVDSGSGAPPPTAAAPAVRLPPTLLRPTLAPSPPRDPFEDAETMRLDARAAVRKSLAAFTKSLAAGRQKALAAATPKKPAPRPGQALKSPGAAGAAADPLDGLVLNATYSGSGRGTAVINGRVYRTGQAVVAGGDPDGATTLGEVRLHSVVLRHQGHDYELKYGATSRPPAAVKPRAKPRVEG